ncbi:hypothetical protein A1F94_009628 [Pyrenophora tritici-repentis]|uniref:Uncharacterized protein n=1 Tax=Pyrenophora tritici-repentis TaxID=45151 RepID=A0A2W1FXW9_9PLEO|nr:hypothetical protein A1F94_009628 [Pyrenophora tritici-repentis]KAI0574741.1 hypothetical protein Alg215_08415 [Pyrenophora tritici-repentis]KAI0590271.1 hypothetical protein Alg130_02411 [Pyrenophora tritici-repentis]KAI0614278.1 hypothetical protein TUN205_01467 [Pyrenophora tritici-repentis]KAI0626342.1 hypothetical protein TUN199_01651 [Pyrenophora tritici-repentis]
MTSNVPDAAQVISQVGSVPYNFVSSMVTASGLIGEATQATISSISFELFSSVYSGDTTFIDDQSFIASCNRGPITTAFIHPPSCTDTLRNEQDMLENSPAVCPYAWTTVKEFTSWAPQYGLLFFTLRPETTAALCCPPGYKYGNDGQVCSSMITHGQAFHFVQYTTNGLNFLPGSTVYTKASTNIPVWGDGVPIWWQSSDAEVLAKVPVMTPAI